MPVATCDDFQSLSGSTLYISATLPATYNEAGYEALTWTEVGGIITIPPLGGTYSEVSIPLVKTGTCKKKGTKEYGTGTIKYAAARDDTGQIAMTTAYGSTAAVAFKVLYPDGDADYVTGIVLSNPSDNGEAGAALTRTCSVSWVSDRVEGSA